MSLLTDPENLEWAKLNNLGQSETPLGMRGHSAQEGAAFHTKIWVLFWGENGEMEAGEAPANGSTPIQLSRLKQKSQIVETSVPCTCKNARLQQAKWHQGTDTNSDPYQPVWTIYTTSLRLHFPICRMGVPVNNGLAHKYSFIINRF